MKTMMKAIVAGVVAVCVSGASLQSVTVPAIFGMIGAGVAAFAAVYFTPNTPTDKGN